MSIIINNMKEILFSYSIPQLINAVGVNENKCICELILSVLHFKIKHQNSYFTPELLAIELSQ